MRIHSWLSNNKSLLQNFTYISILQVFLLVAPLITYPYLVRVLGRDLYGLIITSQVLASYGTIIINFGTDGVCAKFISINRDDKRRLSEIVCSVLGGRAILWLASLILYIGVVVLIPSYRSHFLLFMLSFGLTFNELLFPQYFFQGIEQMKYITLVNIGTKLFFIFLVFIIVKSPEDYLYVPLLYSIGYFVGGVVSLLIVFFVLGIPISKPSFATMKLMVKESSALFATDMICTIKDKLNYLLLGSVGLGNVVVYDLGLKLTSILSKPGSIIGTVVFPKFAKERSLGQFRKLVWLELIIVVALVVIANIFLPTIVQFFIHEKIELLPLRLFLMAAVFLTVSSCIYYNLFVAFGYTKYAFYSIIVTTTAYLLILLGLTLSGYLNNLLAFVVLAVASYFVELIYRLHASRQVARQESIR